MFNTGKYVVGRSVRIVLGYAVASNSAQVAVSSVVLRPIIGLLFVHNERVSNFALSIGVGLWLSVFLQLANLYREINK